MRAFPVTSWSSLEWKFITITLSPLRTGVNVTSSIMLPLGGTSLNKPERNALIKNDLYTIIFKNRCLLNFGLITIFFLYNTHFFSKFAYLVRRLNLYYLMTNIHFCCGWPIYNYSSGIHTFPQVFSFKFRGAYNTQEIFSSVWRYIREVKVSYILGPNYEGESKVLQYFGSMK